MPTAPIIIRCSHMHAQLRRVDPQLWERLETEGIEPQIWAMCVAATSSTDSSRWFRLILTRELPFGDALRLWDGMFAEDPTLAILDYVCLAMLLLIRNERELAGTLLSLHQSSMQTTLLSSHSCYTIHHPRSRTHSNQHLSSPRPGFSEPMYRRLLAPKS